MGLLSCAVGPNYHRPPAPAAESYTRGGDPAHTPAARGVSQHFSRDTALAGDWWNLFDSAALDALVGEALSTNPGLEAARADLSQAQNNLRSGYGIFFPQAALDASATRQRFAPIKFGEAVSGSIFNLFTLSGSVGYALDVFGGERRMIEGLRAEVDLECATERGATLTLVATVVNTVVARAAYQAEVEATRQLLELEREQVSIARTQAEAGTAPYSTVLSLESQLAATEATIPPLEQKLAQSEDLLAALLGHVPASWEPPSIPLDSLRLPAELPLAVPSTLIERRPDILIAEATAHAASAGVGVATANLLPSISLSGSYSANSLKSENLLDARGRAWDAGASLSAPLFEGGTLWYRRKAAMDTYRAASALYRQTVLQAFAQVADTLRALEHDASALAAEDHALDTARQALALVQANYTAGIATYLDLLAADAQVHQAQIADIGDLAVRHQDTVALYVALGGGWWNAPAGAPAASSTTGDTP